MKKSRKTTSEHLQHIRTYLEKKEKPVLVTLLFDLVQEMDEPTRLRFWKRLAPSGIATADLHYPSGEDFLSKLEFFIEEVSEREYYDEEAASYYGDDYYNEFEDYDPDDHAAIEKLSGYFHEADSYFDSGQYAVAAEAYRILLDLALSDTYETLGIPIPMESMDQDERQVIRRYFVALQASQSPEEFFDQALSFLTVHENQTNLEVFLELVGNARPTLQAQLEAWADQHIQIRLSTSLFGLAFRLRLLLQFYEQDGRLDDIRSLWIRFRHMYPACYTPLLADRQAVSDWQAVLDFAHEALEITQPPYPRYTFHDEWESPDILRYAATLPWLILL